VAYYVGFEELWCHMLAARDAIERYSLYLSHQNKKSLCVLNERPEILDFSVLPKPYQNYDAVEHTDCVMF